MTGLPHRLGDRLNMEGVEHWAYFAQEQGIAQKLQMRPLPTNDPEQQFGPIFAKPDGRKPSVHIVLSSFRNIGGLLRIKLQGERCEWVELSRSKRYDFQEFTPVAMLENWFGNLNEDQENGKYIANLLSRAKRACSGHQMSVRDVYKVKVESPIKF